MQIIYTPNAPEPLGHYAQATVHQGVVYVAGQLGINPATGQICAESIEEQAQQALANIGAILQAAGSSLERVLRMTIYVSDVSLWGPVNGIYAQALGAHKPARAVVPVKELPMGAMIEISAIAAVNES